MTLPTIDVGLWNVRTGRSWEKHILPPLAYTLGTLGDTAPDVLFLLECYNTPWSLTRKIPGYSLAYHAYGYPHRHAGRIDEHGATAVLYRDGVKVVDRDPITMTRPWTGPHGAKHHPRIHRATEVIVGDFEWDLMGLHGPFGYLPRRETNQAAVTFLKGPGRRIIVGDFNQNRAKVTARVARPAGARVDGSGVDLAAFNNRVRLVRGRNLGALGSDHDFKIWTFRAQTDRSHVTL